MYFFSFICLKDKKTHALVIQGKVVLLFALSNLSPDDHQSSRLLSGIREAHPKAASSQHPPQNKDSPLCSDSRLQVCVHFLEQYTSLGFRLGLEEAHLS